VKAVLGLRPSEDVETDGLDLAEHGEEGYHYADYSSGRTGVTSEALPVRMNVPSARQKPATT